MSLSKIDQKFMKQRRLSQNEHQHKRDVEKRFLRLELKALARRQRLESRINEQERSRLLSNIPTIDEDVSDDELAEQRKNASRKDEEYHSLIADICLGLHLNAHKHKMDKATSNQHKETSLHAMKHVAAGSAHTIQLPERKPSFERGVRITFEHDQALEGAGVRSMTKLTTGYSQDADKTTKPRQQKYIDDDKVQTTREPQNRKEGGSKLPDVKPASNVVKRGTSSRKFGRPLKWPFEFDYPTVEPCMFVPSVPCHFYPCCEPRKYTHGFALYEPDIPIMQDEQFALHLRVSPAEQDRILRSIQQQSVRRQSKTNAERLELREKLFWRSLEWRTYQRLAAREVKSVSREARLKGRLTGITSKTEIRKPRQQRVKSTS